MFFLRLSLRFKNFFGVFPAFCDRSLRLVPHMQVSSSEASSFLKWIVFLRFCLHHAMCPVFIESLMKPLLTSFRRFSPVIVNCLEQPSLFFQRVFFRRFLAVPLLSSAALCITMTFSAHAWRPGCFFPGFFRRWSPEVNLNQFTTCFPTFRRAPRLCYSDIFAVIFFYHDAPFLSRCASSSTSLVWTFSGGIAPGRFFASYAD